MAAGCSSLISTEAMESELANISRGEGSQLASSALAVQRRGKESFGHSSKESLGRSISPFSIASNAPTVDSHVRAFEARKTTCDAAAQTERAWEWCSDAERRGIFLPPETHEMAMQTVPPNRLIDFKSIGTQVDPPRPMTASIKIQTDHVDSYGALNLTRRTGSAAEDKIKKYAGASGMHKAVAAANARIAVRRMEKMAAEAKEALKKAKKPEKPVATWSYPEDSSELSPPSRRPQSAQAIERQSTTTTTHDLHGRRVEGAVANKLSRSASSSSHQPPKRQLSNVSRDRSGGGDTSPQRRPSTATTHGRRLGSRAHSASVPALGLSTPSMPGSASGEEPGLRRDGSIASITVAMAAISADLERMKEAADRRDLGI